MTKEELDEWSEETDREKQAIIERISEELGDAMDADDELILQDWAFELNL